MPFPCVVTLCVNFPCPRPPGDGGGGGDGECPGKPTLGPPLITLTQDGKTGD